MSFLLRSHEASYGSSGSFSAARLPWTSAQIPMRKGCSIRVSFRLSRKHEPYPGAREATTQADRRAIGAPAARSAHRVVIVELDAVHATCDRRHDLQLVAARLQPHAHGGRNAVLDLDHRPLGPDARRLD